MDQETQKEIKKIVNQENAQLVNAIQNMVKQFNSEMDQIRTQINQIKREVLQQSETISQLSINSKSRSLSSFPQSESRVSVPIHTSSERERQPLDKPIDRIGVAPADVSIEKIFNFGNR
ncbi:MAG: hypothetical protein QXG00_03070 [Candidatus Woesearchaeota archaeon]